MSKKKEEVIDVEDGEIITSVIRCQDYREGLARLCKGLSAERSLVERSEIRRPPRWQCLK